MIFVEGQNNNKTYIYTGQIFPISHLKSVKVLTIIPLLNEN